MLLICTQHIHKQTKDTLRAEFSRKFTAHSAQIGAWVNLAYDCACKMSFYLIFLLESLHLPQGSREGYLRSKAGITSGHPLSPEH